MKFNQPAKFVNIHRTFITFSRMEEILNLLNIFAKVFASNYPRNTRMLAAGECTLMNKLVKNYKEKMKNWRRPVWEVTLDLWK